MEEVRCFGPHLRELKLACLSAPAETDEYEDTLVVELKVLVRLGAEVHPGAQEFAPALCHSGQPRPAAGRRAVGDHGLDLWVRPLGRAVIATLPCVGRAPCRE